MSEKQDDTDDKKDEKTDSQGPLSIGELRDFIKQEITSALGGIKGVAKSDSDPKTTDTTSGQSSSIADEVQREISRLKDREAKSAQEQDLKDQIKALQDKTQEAPPIERRRVHKLMGWGENS